MQRIRFLFFATIALTLTAAFTLSGCGNFFVYPASITTTTTGTGSTTTDYIYTSNSVSGGTYLTGYTVGAGALAAATGSPYSLGVTPLAMAVTPANKFLYVATSNGALYGYTIGTGGALANLSGGTALETENIAALDVSPDGNYLFALDANGLTVSEYQITPSTGALSFANSFNVTGASNGAVTPVSIKVAPSGNFFAIALGTGGVETFSFNESTDTGAPASVISPATSSIGIFAIGIDANNYLYVAGTVGMQVFSVTSAGAASLLSSSSSPYATGAGPVAIAFAKKYAYVYTANANDSTISGFSIGSNGALSAISGSPFAAPASVNGLVADATGTYVFAAGYNATGGNQLLTIGAAGALGGAVSAASGTVTTVPTVVVATH